MERFGWKGNGTNPFYSDEPICFSAWLPPRPDCSEPAFKVDVRLVRLTATVKDPNGELWRGLKK